MHVSSESSEETEARLRRVLASATVERVPGTWAFHDVNGVPSPDRLRSSVACVRDGEQWSCLAPSDDVALELVALFVVHFRDGEDNSGFVGWLATHIKRTVGTGVCVVCGSNPRRGGIFDYWGCPAHMRDAVWSCVEALRR